MTRPTTRSTPTTSGARTPRLFWIDNLRVFLTALVLLHHCAITYSHIPAWTYLEPGRDPSATGLDVLVSVNQMWFMGAFFLISGYFVPGAVDRHGIRGFVRGRLMRLAVPLVVFVVILRPLFVLPLWLRSPERQPGFTGFLADSFGSIDPGPLWFVMVLLVFSLGYAAVRALVDAEPGDDVPHRLRLHVLVLVTFGLGVATYLWRILTPDGSWWPVVGLPTPSYLPQYLLCFVAGVAAARRRWLEHIPVGAGAWSAVLAVAALLGYLTLGSGGDARMMGGPSLVALGAAMLVSATAVFVITAVLVLFRVVARGTGPARQWLSDNAFAVYVVHAPVLALLGMALAGWQAPAAVKALGLFAAGAVASWLLAAATRALPLARRVF
jgi:fucose 4-O-acetylase-like acetyltransferase